MMIKSDTKICVAICSRKRSKGLKRLLGSLQTIALRENVLVLIVENNKNSEYQNLLDELRQNYFNVFYSLEENIGIPYARNRALLEAGKLACEWLAFVDDDCVTHENWLDEMIKCANEHKADVVQGHWKFVAKDRNSKVLGRVDTPWALGQELEMASTSTVLFNLKKLTTDLPELYFDEGMKNSGGSDSKFFYTCFMNHWKIVSCPRSIIYEFVEDERLLLKWILKRRIRESHINFTLRFRNKEYPNSKKLMIKYFLNQAELLIRVILQTIKRKGKTKENSGFIQIALEAATLIGFFSSLTGIKIRKYV